MTVVRFEPAGVEVDDVQVGTALVDVTDEHPESRVPYSCRSASCGTCRVQVLEGLDGLSEIEDEEQDVLDIFGDGPDVRLTCQIKLAEPVGKVTLRVLDADLA